MCLYDIDRLDAGAAQYHAVIRLQPGLHAAHSNLGSTLFRQGSLDGAVERFAKAVRLRPDNPIASLRRCQEPGAGR